jgi:short-subunit dehydrogenase
VGCSSTKNWNITGVNSGFGRELATQLPERDDRIAGTVRDVEKLRDLLDSYPDHFHVEVLDLIDTNRIRMVVDASVTWLGRLDAIVSNAGYGLFGAAEV